MPPRRERSRSRAPSPQGRWRERSPTPPWPVFSLEELTRVLQYQARTTRRICDQLEAVRSRLENEIARLQAELEALQEMVVHLSVRVARGQGLD